MGKPLIPTEPVFRFNGQRQSATFTAGVFAFRDLIDQIHCDSNELDDQAVAERFARSVLTDLAASEDYRLGYAAALANWLGIGRHSKPFPEEWIPLCTDPMYQEVNGADYEDPPEHSLLFDVDGAAVAVTEELGCFQFGPSMCECFDLGDVRERGEPISRRRFDELRGTADMDGPARPAA